MAKELVDRYEAEQSTKFKKNEEQKNRQKIQNVRDAKRKEDAFWSICGQTGGQAIAGAGL